MICLYKKAGYNSDAVVEKFVGGEIYTEKALTDVFYNCDLETSNLF